SCLQKAYRRNHVELMNWTFDWLWLLDQRYTVWRTPILPAEEQWRLMLPTGRLIRQIETKLTSKNPVVAQAVGEELKQHLIQTMATKKNKDADGLRSIAWWAL